MVHEFNLTTEESMLSIWSGILNSSFEINGIVLLPDFDSKANHPLS